MSKFSSKGLSIHISIPLVRGDDAIGDFADEVNSYTHSISASGGYTSCDFTLVGSVEFVEAWLQDGLGRHVQVFNPSQKLIWEGFVNQIDVTMGGAAFTKGPLMGIANRVMAVYTQILVNPDTGLPNNPPETASGFPTLIVEDLNSQERYGIIEKVLNIGEATKVDAEAVRDLYLVENAYPEGNPSLSISGNPEEFSVSVRCRGYIDWLDAYVYNYDNGTEECISLWASDKIIDILEADPNGVISSLYDGVAFNGTLVCDNEVEQRLARTIIDDILMFGGGNYDRWTFGIYADRKAIYAPIPTQVEYIYYKTGSTQQVETVGGEIIDPWDVVPCKWTAIPAVLVSFPIKLTDIRRDPRIFFAEEVSFTAPDKVTINGAKVRTLPQYLAQLGLGGV